MVFWKISNFVVLGFIILICGLGIFYKQITFGNGIGDIVGYIILYFGAFVHLILTIILINKDKSTHFFLTLFSLTFIVLIILYATIWRGSQYRWNGDLFYFPCKTEIKIENDKFEEVKFIKMCSNEYDFNFSGKWDGKYIILEKGKVKIPRELDKNINQPITKVEIESDSYGVFNKNEMKKELWFKIDTLEINKKYSLNGEISSVRNNIPMIKARINEQNNK